MEARRSELIRLSLPAGGGLQVYLSYAGEPAERAVIYVHGLGSTRAGEKALALEQACSRRAWTFASFDFRGHGESTGSLLDLRGTGLLEDMEAVRDYLVGRGIQQSFPVGSSMGGWASAWFAARHPGSVIACACIAPAFDFLRGRWQSLTIQEQEEWRSTGRHRVRNEWMDEDIGYGIVEEMNLFPMEQLATHLSTPIILFHGLRDEIVPYELSLRFAQVASGSDIQLHLYKNGDHRLLAYKEELAETACSFFARALQQSG